MNEQDVLIGFAQYLYARQFQGKEEGTFDEFLSASAGLSKNQLCEVYDFMEKEG